MTSDAATLSRAWSASGLSAAWDLDKNTDLLAQAVQLQQAGKLWDFSVKERPLLLNNEVRDEKESAEAEENNNEQDARLQVDSDDDEEKAQEESATMAQVPDELMEDLAKQLADVVLELRTRRSSREKRAPRFHEDYERCTLVVCCLLFVVCCLLFLFLFLFLLVFGFVFVFV